MEIKTYVNGKLRNPKFQAGKGNFGERMARDYFVSIGHQVLQSKDNLEGTSTRGFDLVTYKNGRVYFIDNKAFARNGIIYSVSALTTNFTRNKAEFERMLMDGLKKPSLQVSGKRLFALALAALRQNKFLSVVTNAVFSKDGIRATGISPKLKAQRIVFANLMK
jgi:hypothetical protein